MQERVDALAPWYPNGLSLLRVGRVLSRSGDDQPRGAATDGRVVFTTFARGASQPPPCMASGRCHALAVLPDPGAASLTKALHERGDIVLEQVWPDGTRERWWYPPDGAVRHVGLHVYKHQLSCLGESDFDGSTSGLQVFNAKGIVVSKAADICGDTVSGER